MQTSLFVFIFIFAFIGGVVGMYFAMRREPKKKPSRKKQTPWLTVHQLETLATIHESKIEKWPLAVRGILLWYTDINLSTLRSLAKRGYVDTASGGRIVATFRGRRRLMEPWPTGQVLDNLKDDGGVSGATEGKAAPAASDAASDRPETFAVPADLKATGKLNVPD